MGDNKEDKTIDPTDMREETSKDKVLKEIEDIDIRAKTIELNEEEVYLKDLQMTTEVNIAAHEEKGSNSIAVKLPSTNGPDVNKDMVVDIAEDPNCKQEESSITKSSEENMVISNENVANVTSLASEASELREAETQGPNEEKEAEFMQQDPEVGTDQKDIEEELPVNVSQDVSESNGVNVEEERRNSNNCKEISNNSNSVAIEEVSSSNVASEEDSTSNPFQESRRETQQEAENEEAQKQDEDLHLSALIQDSSMEKTNENLVETDPKESTEAEAQGPNEEKEAELMQQDPEAGTDQKDIEVELPINASQDVSESNGVNGEEERRNSNNCKEISNNSNSVALEEVSSSNMASEEGSTSSPFQESRRETQQEAENEEAQKQDEDLHLSALIQDSSMEKTNENLVETDPKESTEAEAQGPNEEKEAELMQQDPEAGTDQKDIEVELPINASQDVSESNGVNGEEERRNSNNCKEISNNSNSVALEEVSSSNMASEEGSTSSPFQESRRETQQEAENEEAQKQDEDLHLSALIQDSSMEKTNENLVETDPKETQKQRPKVQMKKKKQN
ncbi:hypothetical protein Pfo_009134 [Paulownia fortunei]|nr:hypothetical protein Pfo_009134 [Paulownia fortunei]